MKILFFITVFSLFILMGAYVSFRGWQALESAGRIRHWYLAGTIFLFLSMMAGLIAARWMPHEIAKVITFVGYSYLIFMLYMLFSFLIVDIIGGLNALIHFAPHGLKVFRFWAFVVSVSVVVVTMIVGNYRFNHPAVVKLDMAVDKPLQQQEVKIVALSDIHLGVSIDKKRLQKYVAMINAQQPDIVLIAGDVTDNATQPVIDQNMAEELSLIQAKWGVWAIPGNHEYYAENPFATSDYLKTAGIITLRDSVALIDNRFYVVGRDDKANYQRKSVSELVAHLDHSKPIILLDHQPYHIYESRENGIDFQFSGHTHNGQIFPGNLIVKAIYELGYGYSKKDNTHTYVSSGLGIWGPQYRIGSQSELVVVQFKF